MTAKPKGERHATPQRADLLLAIDSSTAVGSAAVGADGAAIAEAVFDLGTGHSAALLPAIDWAMRTAGVARTELSGIVVAGGPGSFTGLRIGAATAKGITHALEVPLQAYSSLLVAAATAGSGPRVYAMFDARRGDVYAACYRIDDGGAETLVAPHAAPLDEVLAGVPAGEPALFTGDAALLYRARIERETAGRVVPARHAMPRASALIWLAHVVPERGRVDDAAVWEPDYIRAAGAERIAAARVSGGADGRR